MRFQASHAELSDAVQWVGRTVASRATLPVLTGIMIELEGDKLHLAATDLEVTGQATLGVKGEENGSVVVAGRLLADIVKSLPPAAIEVEDAEGNLKISCGSTTYQIRTMPVEDFPSLPTPGAGGGTLGMGPFGEAVGQVVRAASRDEARPVLTGVLISTAGGQLHLAATDSYRLAVRSLPWPEAGEVERAALVPGRALSEAARAFSSGEVEIGLEDNQITISGPGRRITSRLIEGEFPKYQSLLPTDLPVKARVGREALIEGVKQVAILAQHNSPVRMSFSPGKLELRAETPDLGEAATALPATYDGEPITIAFNPAYLLDGIGACAGDEVEFGLREPGKAALLRDHPDTGFLYLLMPVRIG
ncbi:MAG: DNA polymerase III subunit beta [Actinomycetota bacterium]